MNAKILEYQLIDGIKCYSPHLAYDYFNYLEGGHELTDNNSKNSFWVQSRNRLFKYLIRKSLTGSHIKKVLEIGCATGDLISEIEEFKDLTITGSEIYINGLWYAKQNLPDIEFIQYDVTEGVIGNHFDLIAAFDVIEHIENDVAALGNIFDMLKEGGVAIISVPQYQFMYGNLDKIVCHKRRYSKKELLSKIRDSGFSLQYTTSFVFMLFPIMLILRLLDKKNDTSTSTQKDALEKRAKFNPYLNKALDFVMQADEYLIKKNVSLPFGGTLVVIAKK